MVLKPFLSHTSPLAALTVFSLCALAPGARLAAQPAAIPNAPTVPTAPGLPDAAVVNQPLAPAASQEIIEERPSTQHVWIGGHWRWQEGHYAWIAGRWDLPPRANVAWVEPRWDRRGAGYVLVGGYWQESVPVAAPAPVAVMPATQAPPVMAMPPGTQVVAQVPPTVVVVEQAPPPPVQEVIVERPSPRHVWIGGYWGWRAGRHVWVGGHWELPPRERVEWVEPHWEHRGNGYVFVEGLWRDVGGSGISVGVSIGGPGPGPIVLLREGPPPPRREYIDERHRPSREAIWVSGFWRHDGRAYVWVAGHWDMPPRGMHSWIEPRWESRGGGYVFIEGHWR